MRATLAVLWWCAMAPAVLAQQQQTGLGWSLLPGVGYNSDEGFGLGIDGGLYQYGDGSRMPYRWALEPSLSFTSQGRVSISAFADVPRAFGERVRVTGRANVDLDCCQPYYGLGNAAPYDPSLATRAALPNYYTFDRDRVSAALDVQWMLVPHLRLLTGAAVSWNDAGARDSSTQFARDRADGTLGSADDRSTALGPKLGLVYDTRDAERDPRRGLWLEGIAWRGLVWPAGGGSGFTRVSGTARGYLSPRAWLTLAARVFGERVYGAMPVPLLSELGSSFQDFNGIGGAGSIRGVFRQRFLGRARTLANLEVRWRGPGFRLFDAPWRLGAVGFVDAGRVWDDRGLGDGAAGLHWGKGVGLRIAWGASFIIGADFGHGSEAGLQTYLRLGHLF